MVQVSVKICGVQLSSVALKMGLKVNCQGVRATKLGGCHRALPPPQPEYLFKVRFNLNNKKNMLIKDVSKLLLLTISPHFTEEKTELLRSSVLPKVTQCICSNLDPSLELLVPSPVSIPPEHLVATLDTGSCQESVFY